jgi:hypothetical protein
LNAPVSTFRATMGDDLEDLAVAVAVAAQRLAFARHRWRRVR